MKEAERIGVSIDPDLLERFDEKIKEKMYTNRSEAIRDLIRNFLIENDIEKKGEVIGSLTLIYKHEVEGVSKKLVRLQHRAKSEVISSMHMHLDEDLCMEVLAIKGEANDIKKMSDKLTSSRGVKHGKLFLSSTDNVF
ncbi:nickel-responsive transcriptional regulator NikR [archaeon SCG-AAA382B04]|nr:nickel-responsive transcriptional regulator NikR [archaeon SCG-AAA382B04]